MQHLCYTNTHYTNSRPVSSRTARGEGKPLPHMLSQEREEGEFLGVGGARLRVVGRREVGEEGRLEGGGNNTALAETILKKYRGRYTLMCVLQFSANLPSTSPSPS